MTIIPEIDALTQDMARWRHDIHKHPDTRLTDLRTSSKVAELLRSFGVDEVHEQYADAGVIGVLRNSEGPVVAIFAGMIGQRFQEHNTHLEYASVVPNGTHALGHDGETAISLGIAKYLAETRRFKGTVVFIFSIWDGGSLGAQTMIENGLFEQFPISVAYGLKAIPHLDVGDVSIISGPAMSAISELMIRIEGKEGHNGVPNQARNPIFTGAEIVNSLGNLVASEIDPTHPLLIGMSSFNAGNSFSYIPGVAEIKASVRYLTAEIEEWLPRRIEALVDNIAASYDVKANISYRQVCPVCMNDQHVVDKARIVAADLFGSSHVLELRPPTLLGWDLSALLHEIPGAVIHLGNGLKSAPLMSSGFDFNDALLPLGASLLVKLIETQ